MTSTCGIGMLNSQRASIISRPLLNMVAESMVILRPITHEGCFRRLFDRDASEVFERRLPERSTRGGQDQASHRVGRATVEALENCRMFAVDRQHVHAVFSCLGHDDFAGHDEDFLGGHGDVLPSPNRSECRLQSGSADDGDQHNVRAWQCGQQSNPPHH